MDSTSRLCEQFKMDNKSASLQVLSLGMPRTGTASMQASLRLLGYYDVRHGFVPSSTSNWEAVTDAESNGNIGLCSRTASHCAAVTDSPCAFFAENLVNAYPEIYSSTKAEAVVICCLLRGIYKRESSLSNEVTRNAMPVRPVFHGISIRRFRPLLP